VTNHHDADEPQLDAAHIEPPVESLAPRRRPSLTGNMLKIGLLGIGIAVFVGAFILTPMLNRRSDSVGGGPTPTPTVTPIALTPSAVGQNVLVSPVPGATPTPPIGAAGVPVAAAANTPATPEVARSLDGIRDGLQAASDSPPIMRAAAPADVNPTVPPSMVASMRAIGKPADASADDHDTPPKLAQPVGGDVTAPAPQVAQPASTREDSAIVSGGISARAPSVPDPAGASQNPQIVSRTANDGIVASRQAFASSAGAPPGTSNAKLYDPASRFITRAGTPIRMQLDDAINSSQPSPIFAHVLTDVHCSLAPYPVCIPRGTTAQGRANTAVNAGDSRIEVVWDTLTFPDGRAFSLEGMQGSDVTGESGLAASVDNHAGRILTTTILTAVLASGAQLAQPQSSGQLTPSVGQQIAGVAGGSISSTGQQLVAQQVARPPTLTVERGREFMIRLRSTIDIGPVRDEE
jgi:type IV secretion system protein VirB10